MQLSKKWEGRRGVLLNILARLLPMDKKRVLFYSCLNQYNDNPKYIAEKLHEMAPDLHYVWVTGNLDVTADIPSWFKQVKYNSLRYYYQKGRSKVLVDNGRGLYGGRGPTKRRLLGIKNSQQNISTWHGQQLKQDEQINDNNGFDDGQEFFSSSTLLVLGSEWEKQFHAKVTDETIPIRLTGNPRADLLFSATSEIKAKLREKLHLPSDKKIVLYAPTYRDDVEWSGIRQLKELDKDRLLQSFSKSFGGEWCLAIRFHQIARQMLAKSGLPVGDLLDANQFADMMEYLVACDAIITDYSASMFDCAIGGIPCFLFIPDLEIYSKTRGIRESFDTMPFPSARQPNELYKQIGNFDLQGYQNSCAAFLKKTGDVNRGDASQQIAMIILEMIAQSNR